MIKGEPPAHLHLLRREGLVKTAAGVAVLLSLAGCSSSKQASAKPSVAASPAVHYTNVVPDMSGFTKPGNATKCFNGGPRPCAILLRTEPRLSAPYINAKPTQNTVLWPREAYDGQDGDGVVAECYKSNGQFVAPYEGSAANKGSRYWYKVIVPEERILNPAVTSEINAPTTPIPTFYFGGQVAIAGWASVEWFDKRTPNPAVRPC